MTVLLVLLPGSTSLTIDSAPQHYIYFGLERDRIQEASFLETPSIVGAQLKYTWRELEPERDTYALQDVRERLAFLERHGKRLFIQIQDVSFDETIINVPDYLLEDTTFHGGVALKYEFEEDDEDKPVIDGWVARRWDPAVQRRLGKLFFALSQEFDGQIEGINLAETSIGFGDRGDRHPEGFTYEGYVEGIKVLMTVARTAFSQAHVIQYANFMPGEWLPWTDNGYLRRIYAHADSIGVGIGGPDILPHRRSQKNHSYPLIAARGPETIAGAAVQWGNLEDLNPATGQRVTVAELAHFAQHTLRLDYVFWGTQEPYYKEEILPYLRTVTSGHKP